MTKLGIEQLALDRYNKALRRIYKDLEQLDRLSIEKPNKEQVIKRLEQIFGELEEGKIILSPSIREHFEMECCNDKNY